MPQRLPPGSWTRSRASRERKSTASSNNPSHGRRPMCGWPPWRSWRAEWDLGSRSPARPETQTRVCAAGDLLKTGPRLDPGDPGGPRATLTTRRTPARRWTCFESGADAGSDTWDRNPGELLDLTSSWTLPLFPSADFHTATHTPARPPPNYQPSWFASAVRFPRAIAPPWAFADEPDLRLR